MPIVFTPLLPSAAVKNVVIKEHDFVIKEHDIDTYTAKQWLIKFQHLEPDYVEEMFAYLSSGMQTHIMQADFISPFRRKLVGCITDKLRFTSEGECINIDILSTPEEKNNVYSNLGAAAHRVDMAGFLIFLILMYEEDKIVDTAYDEYKISDTNAYEITALKSCAKDESTYSFFALLDPKKYTTNIDKIVENPCSFRVVKLLFTYSYKRKVTYLCIGEHNKKHFLFKCFTETTNPAIGYVNQMFNNSNIMLDIHDVSGIRVKKNTNGSSVLSIPAHCWKFK